MSVTERTEFMQESDIAWIAEQGFDHIRVPFSESNLYDEDGARVDSNWMLLHQMLGWIEDNNMRAVADLHVSRVHDIHDDDSALYRQDTALQHFTSVWQKLQTEFGQYSNDFLAYEILNEPVPADADDWNRVFAHVYREIRQTDFC